MDSTTAYVKASSVSGKGIFAAAELSTAEIIITRPRPLVAVLDLARVSDTCSNCFIFESGGASSAINTIPTLVCAGCKILHYCSQGNLSHFKFDRVCKQQCQRQSWKREHKHECAIFKKTAARGVLPNALRAVLRMIRIDESSSPSPFRDMVDNLPNEPGSVLFERDDDMRIMSLGIHHISETRLPVRLTQRYCSVVLMNALTLETPLLDSLGICIDPIVCTINHSCTPNAFVVFDGSRMSVRAMNGITKDEEIFISYTDVTANYAQRQHDLQAKYKFSCRCARCQAEALPNPEQLETISLQLQAHGKLVSSHKASNITARMILLNEALQICISHSRWPAYLWPLPDIRQNISAVCARPGLWIHGLAQCMKLHLEIYPVIYPQQHHPDRVVTTWAFAKLTSQLAHEPEAQLATRHLAAPGFSMSIISWALLRIVAQAVDSSHGADSGFARIVKHGFQDATESITRGNKSTISQLDELAARQWALLSDSAIFKNVNKGISL